MVNIVMYGSSRSSPDSSSSQSFNVPVHVNATAHKRMQLVVSAASKLVPTGESPAVPLDLLDIAGFNAIQIRQPALEAAIDTLALVQLGTSSKDRTLLACAQREYGRALSLLNSYITNTFRVWDDQMASAIVVLKYCESFQSLNHAYYGGTFGSIHHLGLESFYLSRGPVPFKNNGESFLFCQARVIILGGSFIKRQRCFLEDAEWIEVSRTAPGRDDFFQLEDLAVRLPGLLEHADSSIRSADEDARRDAMVSIRSFISELDAFATYCWPSGLDTTEAYDTSTWLSTSRPYRFDSWRTTNLFCTWNIVRMFALLELQRLYSYNTDDANSWCESELWRGDELVGEIERSTEDVCRSIPAQIGLQPHTLGIIASLLMLPMLAKLLEKQGRMMEAEWCKTTLKKLRMQGYR